MTHSAFPDTIMIAENRAALQRVEGGNAAVAPVKSLRTFDTLPAATFSPLPPSFPSSLPFAHSSAFPVCYRKYLFTRSGQLRVLEPAGRATIFEVGNHNYV